MCKNIDVMLSMDKQENEILEEILTPLKGKIDINRMVRGQKTFDPSELPFIQTDEGLNYYGLDSAKRFVDRELRLRNGTRQH